MPYADCISMKSSNSNSGRDYYFNWIAGVGTNHEKNCVRLARMPKNQSLRRCGRHQIASYQVSTKGPQITRTASQDGATRRTRARSSYPFSDLSCDFQATTATMIARVAVTRKMLHRIADIRSSEAAIEQGYAMTARNCVTKLMSADETVATKDQWILSAPRHLMQLNQRHMIARYWPSSRGDARTIEFSDDRTIRVATQRDFRGRSAHDTGNDAFLFCRS